MNVLVLDGISLVVFIVLFIVLCLIGVISSLGWMYESEQRTKAQHRADELADDIRISELCGKHVKGYEECIAKYEKQIAKERKQ